VLSYSYGTCQINSRSLLCVGTIVCRKIRCFLIYRNRWGRLLIRVLNRIPTMVFMLMLYKVEWPHLSGHIMWLRLCQVCKFAMQGTATLVGKGHFRGLASLRPSAPSEKRLQYYQLANRDNDFRYYS